MMNLGSTYDGDFGNEVVMGDVTVSGFETNSTGTSVKCDYKYIDANDENKERLLKLISHGSSAMEQLHSQ